MRYRHNPNTRHLVLALIICLAVGLRLNGITFDSMWLDESYQTMHGAMGYPPYPIVFLRGEPVLYKIDQPRPLSQTLANWPEVDFHCPPLYAVLLNRWCTALNTLGLPGTGDFCIRALSAIFSTLSVAVTYVGGSLLFGPLVGSLAALIAAISPFDIYYAQEARMYALEILTCNISSLSLIWLLRHSKEDVSFKMTVLLYAASTWAAVNTHYTALFLLIAQGLASIVVCIRRRDPRLFGWLMTGWTGVWMLSLPWAHFLVHTSESTNGIYISRKFSLWWPFYGLLCRIPYDWLSFLAGRKVAVYAWISYLTAAVLTASGFISLRTRDCRNQTRYNERFAKFGIAVWCVLPPVLLWLYDCLENLKTIEISRYMACSAPAVYILAALGLAFCLRLHKSMAWLVALHSFFCLANLYYMHTVYQRTPWRQMAQIVEQSVKADDLILVSQYFNVICLDRYLSKPYRQIGISPNQGAEHVRRILLEEVQPKQFWLITCDDGLPSERMMPPEFSRSERRVLPKNLILSKWVRK